MMDSGATKRTRMPAVSSSGIFRWNWHLFTKIITVAAVSQGQSLRRSG